jgi:hypothetical protein
VRLARSGIPVETLDHEVGTPVLLQQPAVGHVDAGAAGHEVVGVFDAPVMAPCTKFVVQPDTIEFEQPVLEAGIGRQRPGAQFTRDGVQRHHRLGTGTTGGGADVYMGVSLRIVVWADASGTPAGGAARPPHWRA